LPAKEYPEEAVRKIVEDCGIDEETKKITIDEKVMKNRMDLRKLLIASVDPATARDLDDALSVEEEGDGTFKIGVHIADVSYFVEKGTYVDEEAGKRSNSYYFPHRVFPMLPEILCECLCSLNPGEDRLAFSIFFWMSKEGELLREKEPVLSKSVIHSCVKLSYEGAQEIIDNKINDESDYPREQFPLHNDFKVTDLVWGIRTLNEIA
jgi:DIS3-like exonuclease 2